MLSVLKRILLIQKLCIKRLRNSKFKIILKKSLTKKLIANESSSNLDLSDHTTSSLWRACNLTAFIHSGPPICFPSWGTWVQSPGGYLCETRILLLALSCYIGDPDVIDDCGLIWGGLCLEPSLGCRADNVIIPLDLTQLSCPGFTLAAGPLSGFTTDIVGCWGGALWRATISLHSYTVPLV
jgi:hypothetical protein